MSVYISEEMYRLFDIFFPWINLDEECSFKENAPKEAIEARKKFDILYDEQYQIALKNQLAG